ncbi:hypothetical protein E2C01_027279 [Portunus trituberculatus]|uniref:Uncharacterized protein n=1 Tax=Portunus trituberculatus TaxID=210409 RepID=A0A5B7EHS4_PORTR|nr:hypothetical protein [Portunus trituberculatus]
MGAGGAVGLLGEVPVCMSGREAFVPIKSQQPTARRSFSSYSASGGVPRLTRPLAWLLLEPSTRQKMRVPHCLLSIVHCEIVKQLW